MQDSTRRALALIAGTAITKQHFNLVQDHGANRTFAFSVSVTGSAVVACDKSTGHMITGTLSNLFHHGVGQHLYLVISEQSFQGMDYGSNHHYRGSVGANSVTIFDFQTMHEHRYTLLTPPEPNSDSPLSARGRGAGDEGAAPQPE